MRLISADDTEVLMITDIAIARYIDFINKLTPYRIAKNLPEINRNSSIRMIATSFIFYNYIESNTEFSSLNYFDQLFYFSEISLPSFYMIRSQMEIHRKWTLILSRLINQYIEQPYRLHRLIAFIVIRQRPKLVAWRQLIGCIRCVDYFEYRRN